MNKSILYLSVLAIVMSVACVSCSPDLKDNPYLGKVPALRIAQDADYEALKEKYKKRNDFEAYAKYEEARKKLNDKYNALYEEESARLAGREIPYVLYEGLSYKINGPVTVSKVDGGTVYITYEIELVRNLGAYEEIYLVPASGDFMLGGQLGYALDRGSYSKVRKAGDKTQIEQQIAMPTNIERWTEMTVLEFTDKATYLNYLVGGDRITQ